MKKEPNPFCIAVTVIDANPKPEPEHLSEPATEIIEEDDDDITQISSSN